MRLLQEAKIRTLSKNAMFEQLNDQFLLVDTNVKVNEGSLNRILISAKTNIDLRQEDVLVLVEFQVRRHKNVSSVYDEIDC